MDLRLEAAAGPPRALEPARLRAYARWTLTVEEPPDLDAPRGLAARLLIRGALAAPTPALGRLRAGQARWAHRLQLAALLGAPRLPERLVLDDPELEPLVEPALRDLRVLLEALGGSLSASEPLFVSTGGAAHPRLRTVIVHEGWADEAPAWRPRIPRPAPLPSEAALRWLLRWLFVHDDFRRGQAEAVAALLRGEDVAAAMPTGAGKSIIYQLAALLSPGTAVVAQPLLALIADQLDGLRRLGIGCAAGLRGDAPSSDALRRLADGELALCYVSPERFESAAFRDALRACAEGDGVSFVAVDEAHCVADWGWDFRPAFRHLGRRARRWGQSEARLPPLVALSGTASPEELARACGELGARPAVLARGGEPPDLRFSVEVLAPGRAVARARELAAARRRQPGLVFCRHVDGPRGAVEVAEELALGENLETGCFTGRAPAGRDAEGWRRRKEADAARFLSGELALMVCTPAFGMGVHRADARWTIHLGLPPSLENLLQEAGRAGRDGRGADCSVLLELRSERTARRLLAGRLDVEDLPWDAHDDVARALLLHRSSYPGMKRELDEVEEVLRRLEDGPLRLSGADDAEALERAVDRLALAGLVELEDRRPGLLVAGWTEAGRDRAARLASAQAAVRRVYDEQEPARRRRLEATLDWCLERGGRPAWSLLHLWR